MTPSGVLELTSEREAVQPEYTIYRRRFIKVTAAHPKETNAKREIVTRNAEGIHGRKMSIKISPSN